MKDCLYVEGVTAFLDRLSLEIHMPGSKIYPLKSLLIFSTEILCILPVIELFHPQIQSTFSPEL